MMLVVVIGLCGVKVILVRGELLLPLPVAHLLVMLLRVLLPRWCILLRLVLVLLL